jgi:integrase
VATQDVEDSARRNDRAVFSAYVKPWFGGLAVSGVTTPMVREWVAGFRTKLVPAAPRAKREASRVLRCVLGHAFEEGRTARSPACGIKEPGAKGTPDQVFSLSELRVFIDALQVGYRDVARVLALAGLRWSELAALDERDVVRDGDRVFLVVRRRRVRSDDGQWAAFAGTEAGREVTRLVPLLPELVPLVESRLTGMPSAPLFASPCGARLDSHYWCRDAGWQEACEAVGRAGLRLQDLRRTYVSLLCDGGTPLASMSRLVGHSGSIVTEAAGCRQLRLVVQTGGTAMDRLIGELQAAGGEYM